MGGMCLERILSSGTAIAPWVRVTSKNFKFCDNYDSKIVLIEILSSVSPRVKRKNDGLRPVAQLICIIISQDSRL